MSYKILFLVNPFSGHINTTLEVVKELVKEGHEVVYTTNQHYKQLIENTGATVELLDHPCFELNKEQMIEGCQYLQTDQAKVLTWMIRWVMRCNFAAVQVVKKLESQKFDLVLYDEVPLQYNYQIAKKVSSKCYGTWQISQVISTKDGVPESKINSISSLAYLVLVITWMYMNLLYLRVVHQFKFSSILAPISVREDFNMVCIPKEFQHPSQDQALDFTKDTRFYYDGPFTREEDSKYEVRDFPFHQLTREKTMYISLGTVTTFQDIIYNTFMEAYTHPYFEDWNIILNCDDVNKLTKRGQIPDNFLVQQFVPQIAVLKCCNFYVCHGGINSVMEAVMCNVPQLILPQIPERQMNAKSVKKLGLGDYVSQQCTAKELREKSITVIEDKQINQSIEKFKHTLQQQSPRKAVKHIVEYIKKCSN